MAIWQILIQFVFRLTFGVALALGVTPPRWVTGGFYRAGLLVLMGCNTLAALAVYSQREALPRGTLVLGLGVLLVVLSYVGSVAWLYERTRVGSTILFAVTLAALLAAAWATPRGKATTGLGAILAWLDLGTSGVLLGATLAAMFLGHWYLNTPTMQLVPLRRLVILVIAAIVARAVVSGAGLVLQIGSAGELATVFWVFVGLRWLSGLVGTLMLALMTWYVLRIPNPQSATGILYAGVVLTFIGELTSQLLSVDARYPL